MLRRRHFKHTASLKERLDTFAKEAREKASELPPGPDQEALLKKVRQAETAVRMINGPLRPD